MRQKPQIADTSFRALKVLVYIITADVPRCVQPNREALPLQLGEKLPTSQSALFTKMRQSKCALVFLITGL